MISTTTHLSPLATTNHTAAFSPASRRRRRQRNGRARTRDALCGRLRANDQVSNGTPFRHRPTAPQEPREERLAIRKEKPASETVGNSAILAAAMRAHSFSRTPESFYLFGPFFANSRGAAPIALSNLSRQVNAVCHISMGRHGSAVSAFCVEDRVGAGVVYR